MSYENIICKNQAWIENTWRKLDNKLSKLAIKSRNKLPYTTVDGVHTDQATTEAREGVHWWTNGFWGGLMWIMYVGTNNEEYKRTAERSEELLDAAFENVELLHHDVGFMWHLTSGANYRLTGNKRSRNRNLIAAMTLMSRYNVEGNYIRSWNRDSDNPANDRGGWTIIDCMMNIPLLYWASEQIGDTRFKKIAVRYADMAVRDHVRADGSVNHIVIHDTEKADTVLDTLGGQGYAKGSSWSRGTAWALYGFVLSYIHTKEQRYLDTAKRVANYFIENAEKTDWLTLVDFRAPETPVYYDSTAGVIAACGLIEIAKNISDAEGDVYLKAALNILQATERDWCDWSEKEDSVVQMGSESYSGGQHMPIIYGDYFFAEAILKLKGSKFLPW